MSVHEKCTDSQKTPTRLTAVKLAATNQNFGSWIGMSSETAPSITFGRNGAENDTRSSSSPSCQNYEYLTNEVRAEQTTCAGLHSWPTTSQCAMEE